jgi:hypothetical protein
MSRLVVLECAVNGGHLLSVGIGEQEAASGSSRRRFIAAWRASRFANSSLIERADTPSLMA